MTRSLARSGPIENTAHNLLREVLAGGAATDDEALAQADAAIKRVG